MEGININAREVDKYIYDEDTIIVDLRSKEEYGAYHIENAVNFPDDVIFDKLYVLDKYKLTILYCDRGVNSLMVAKQLRGMNYNAKSVVGGMNFYRQSHKR